MIINVVIIMFWEGLMIIGLFCFMFYINWVLILIFLVVGLVIGVVVSYVSKCFCWISKCIQGFMGDIIYVVFEFIVGYWVVCIFGGEDYE